MDIILASASPRRKDLLLGAGLKFRVCVPDTDESTEETAPDKYVMLLAERKADAVLKHYPESTAVAADTIVYLPTHGIFGKPTDINDARRMLCLLSGNTHEVYTGVCIADRNTKTIFYEKTAVTFSVLTESETDGYLATGEYKDKAGAYAIQGRAGVFIKKIEGDYFNVVGLPLPRVYGILKDRGAVFWDFTT